MEFIGNLKIGRRLGICFGVVLLLLACVAGLGLSRMAEINRATKQITQINNPETKLAMSMRISVNRVGAAARDIVLLTDDAESQATAEALKGFRADYDASEEDLARMLDAQSDTAPRKKELFARIKELKNQARPALTKVVELGLANNNDEAVKVLMKEALPAQRVWLSALGELAEFELKASDEAASAAERTYEKATMLVFVLSTIAVGLGIGAALLITKSIAIPIRNAVQLTQTVAVGDLTSPIAVNSRDETGALLTAMGNMQENLAKVVASVRESSESVATASAQIAQGNNDLSQRTEEQASALEETAASMEELSATVRQNADNAREANQLAQNASAVALKGGDVVAQAVETMRGINDSSRRISEIISVIDGIAFQTNILALNAAVEAARAGEQGRGFAVVASEVRNLAGRSAEAAKEIASLIHASVQRVEQGTVLVDQAGATMTEVVGSIRRVTDLMGEISAASSEQSAGVAQVGAAVTQMDQATQQNAALVEEMAAAASSLKSQALELVSTVAVFKLPAVGTPYVQGSSGQRPVRTKPARLAAPELA